MLDVLRYLDHEWPLTVEQIQRSLRGNGQTVSAAEIESALRREKLAVEVAGGWIREFEKPVPVKVEKGQRMLAGME